MTAFEDRRQDPRKSANRRAVVTAPGLELGCAVVDLSTGGMRLRLERGLALPPRVVVVEVAAALAHEVEVVWSRGHEVGVKRLSAGVSLRGLTPQRLTAARDAWMRAKSR